MRRYEPLAQRLGRRSVLRGAAYSAGFLSAAMLASCGSSKSNQNASGAGGTSTVGSSVPGAAASRSAGSPAAATVKRGGTLRALYTLDLQPANLPHQLTGGTNDFAGTTIFDALVDYDKDRNLLPQLGASWEFSPDSLALTFKLRTAKFHSGRPFSSDDVKFNIQRVQAKATGSQLAGYSNMITGIETPDPQTAVLKFDQPRRSIMDMLYYLAMTDRDTIDNSKDGKAYNGTGPFKFKEWVPNDHYTLERNPDYWDTGKPYLDGATVRGIADDQARLIDFQSGNSDIMFDIPLSSGADLQKNSKVTVLPAKSEQNFWYVGADLSFAPLADKRVRQALNYAIDRKRIVASSMFGFGRATPTLWSQNSPAYLPEYEQAYGFDLTKAKQLLDAAGWDPSTSLPFTFTSGDVPGTFAPILQSDFAKIGVKLEIQPSQGAEVLQKLSTASFKGLWSANIGFMHLQPVTLFVQAFPARAANASNFKNDRYQALITGMLSETDELKQKANYKEITGIMLDESFIMPITPRIRVYAWQKNVQNVDYNVDDVIFVDQVSINKA